MYFVRARTSGGGVGSSRPRSESEGVYCLLVGLTGLFGSSDRSFAVKLLDGRALGAGVARTGAGVGRIATGRAGALVLLGPLPARGPGEAPPFGPGLGAVPAVEATARALVGLGLGTPGCSAGEAEARGAGAAVTVGEAVARATAAIVGDAFGTGGAGVAGFGLGVAAATTTEGLGEGRTEGGAVGAGDGAVVGGGLVLTATGATVGTLTGAAGTWLRG